MAVSLFNHKVEPFYFDISGLQLGNCHYSEQQTGALVLVPRSSGAGLSLVLTANSMTGLWDVVSLATPTIPPMTRSPVSTGLYF